MRKGGSARPVRVATKSRVEAQRQAGMPAGTLLLMHSTASEASAVSTHIHLRFINRKKSREQRR